MLAQKQKQAQDLAGLSDDELISNVKTKLCNDSFAVLSEKYEKVFYKICQRYSYALEKSGVNPVDIFDLKTEILYFCVLKYDKSRGMRFSSFLGSRARFLCLNSITARRLLVNCEDDEVKKFIEDRQENTSYNDPPVDYENLLHILGKLQDKRGREILKLRYFTYPKMTWKQISDITQTSIQTAIGVHNRTLKTLKIKIKTKDSL